MPNVKITDLPAAQPLNGSEIVPMVQNGVTVRATTAAISASPSLTQTFLTLNQELTLPNSRALSAGTGIGLTDAGALSTLQIALNGASGSLEGAGNGLIAKTGSGTVIARSLAVSGDGLSVSDADGVSGNPTLSLDGIALALAQMGGTGIVAIQSGSTAGTVLIAGTTNQLGVTNGNGSGGNPTIYIVDNVVLPGTGGVFVPKGTSAEEPVGSAGQFRFNTDTQTFDGYAAGSWRQFSLAGGVTTFSGGSTGLTPSSATSGVVVLGGTLNPASGGTGVNNGSYSITLGGNVSTAGEFTTSGAYSIALTATGATSVTLPTSGTLATLAGAETLTNKTISGSSNTLSNIANASLTNSSVTYNGITVALGGSGTITATTTAALTVSTGLQLDSGTTFDGSTAKTISIDSTVVTLTGAQTLTNKTLTAPVIATIVNTGTLTLPTSTDTLVGRDTTDTLTNKTISGSSNTLSNIANSSLTNSSITIGTDTVSLGGTLSTLNGVSISGSANTLSSIGNSSLVNSSVTIGSDTLNLGGTLSTLNGVSISGASNTLSNIGNSSLTNSSVTIGSTSISLGGTASSLAGLSSVTVTADPTTNLELATKQYVDTVAVQSIHYHQAVKYEVPNTTGNLNATYNNGASGVGATLTNAGTLAAFSPDGTVASVNDRILIYNQTNGYENGVYVVTTVGDGSTAWVLTRASDADTYDPISPNALGGGDAFYVTSGNTGAGETYVCTNTGAITFGTTNITFTQISATQVYSAGTGLTLTGTQFSLNTPVAENLGGTGQSSYTTGDLLYASGSTAISKLGIGTSTYILTSSGSAPQWSDPSGISVGSSTNATNTGITADSTNATMYLSFVSATTGNLPQLVNSSLTVNPSTGKITSGISGGTF